MTSSETATKQVNTKKMKSQNTVLKGKESKFKNKYKKPFGKSGKSKNIIKNESGAGGQSEKSLSATALPEKPDWKKFKEEKKNLKLKRQSKTHKDLFALKQESKKLYEKLKCRKTIQRSDLAEELFKLLNHDNNIQKFVLGHDTSRIIQCLLKHSSPKIREEISSQLIPISPELSKSRYAHFCVLRMIKYGSKNTKQKLVGSLMGNIIKLSSNVISSKIIDMIYFNNNIATKLQKIQMKQEFYGDFYVKTKDVTVKKLSDTFLNSPNLRSGILGSLKEKLIHLANKNMTDNSLVHAVLYEYIEEIIETSGGKAEVKLEEDEIIKSFALLTPTLVTSYLGAKSAVWCFWLSSTKDRRAIVKSLKDHLVKIATHEHGYTFVISIINTLDDTKSIKKNIFDVLLPNLPTLLDDAWGRKIIEWFVFPENTKSFHPKLIEFFNLGLKYSKKDKEIRQKEIYEQIEEPLTKALIANPEIWVLNGQRGLVMATFFNVISNQYAEDAFSTISNQICSENWKIENKSKNIKVQESEPTDGISDSGIHFVLMKILKNDADRSVKNLITFRDTLVKHLDNNIVKKWINHNRGCFILLKLLETCNDENKEKLEKKLSAIRNEIQMQETVGAKLLIKKL